MLGSTGESWSISLSAGTGHGKTTLHTFRVKKSLVSPAGSLSSGSRMSHGNAKFVRLKKRKLGKGDNVCCPKNENERDIYI
jgi:hypothetical protein